MNGVHSSPVILQDWFRLFFFEVGLCAKVSDVAVAELAKNIIARC